MGHDPIADLLQEGDLAAADGEVDEAIQLFLKAAQAADDAADARIIRNRAKIGAAIANARATIRLQKEHGSLDVFLWNFVGGKPRLNAYRDVSELPAQTAESQAMSKALRSYGFSFVGPTICYAFMQSAGLVNDHVTSCFRYTDQ